MNNIMIIISNTYLMNNYNFREIRLAHPITTMSTLRSELTTLPIHLSTLYTTITCTITWVNRGCAQPHPIPSTIATIHPPSHPLSLTTPSSTVPISTHPMVSLILLNLLIIILIN